MWTQLMCNKDSFFRTLAPLKKNPAFFELILSAPVAYGPFWVSTTLIFCLASCSNVASYLDVVGDRSGWSYDFSRLASAYTLVDTFLFGLYIYIYIRCILDKIKLIYDTFLYVQISSYQEPDNLKFYGIEKPSKTYWLFYISRVLDKLISSISSHRNHGEETQ
jgi:hypothetical protein